MLKLAQLLKEQEEEQLDLTRPFEPVELPQNPAAAIPYASINDAQMAEAELEAMPVQADVPANYNEMLQAEAMEQAPPLAGATRNPSAAAPAPKAGTVSSAATPTVAPESTPLSAQEKLLQQLAELKKNRSAEMDSAESRQMWANIVKGITDNAGLLVAGRQAINTGASVAAPQVRGFDPGDLTAKVDAKYKPELDSLMQQYKALQDGNKPMTPYQREMLKFYRDSLEQKKEMGEMTHVRHQDNYGLRGKALDHKIEQKFGDDARNALKDMRFTETFKSAEKTLSEIPGLKTILDDAYKKGGNSLAMLGPKVAKAIAGEVGVLTEADVTRYVKNPELIGGYLDTIAKIKSGKLSEASYENLKRLLELSEKNAKDKMDKAIHTEAIKYSRREKIPYEDARYYLDDAFSRKQESSSEESPSVVSPTTKTVVNKQYSPSRNQTRIIYSDGTVEVKDGK